MAAGKYDFSIEQGTTMDVQFFWKDSLSAPINLTGYIIRMQVRPTITSNTVLTEFSTTLGNIVIGPATGEFHVIETAANTAAWTFSNGVYDLEVQSAAGKVTRLLKGAFSVDPEVTR